MSNLDISLGPAAPARASGLSTTVYAVFTASIFLSAGLLFMVQPMFGKLTLPLLGGTPSVWNTAMVFFQAMLLAGYVYAHLISKLRSLRLQQGIHLAVLLAATLALPLSIGQAWRTPPEGAPMVWLLGLLAINVGPPFFALSANAPLLQKWFSKTNHPQAHDPYFLYAASNLGSFIGLLGYPLLIEPSLTLGAQSTLWLGGYMALIALLALGVYKSQAAKASGPIQQTAVDSAPISARRRLHWIWLSALPSGLLLSVTNHITTDIVAVPLLWVVPLALYLLTFSIVFSAKPVIPHKVSLALQPLFLLLALTTQYIVSGINLLTLGILAIAAFFLTALVAHGELAKDRPSPQHLTQFYICMSLGGVIGGSLIALGAPLVFSSIIEYPALLIAAAFVRPWHRSKSRADLYLPAALGGAVFLAEFLLDLQYLDEPISLALFVLLVTCVFKAGTTPLRLGFLLIATAGFGYSLGLTMNTADTVLQSRTFFGVHTVKKDERDGAMKLYHGTVLHGMQFTDPLRAREPLLYYDRDAGMGRAIAAANARGGVETVGIVGLGSGATACYAQPGQSWTYFEIDPHVAKIASDPAYFSHLKTCTPDLNIVLGDARLTLANAAADSLDILVIDAFTSDAIPLHLLTREAFTLYDEQLSANGVLLIHISNRYLDLEPVLANMAQSKGFEARIFDFIPPDRVKPTHRTRSQWVMMTRDQAYADALAPQIDVADRQAFSVWRPLERRSDLPLWSDDFSNIFDILK